MSPNTLRRSTRLKDNTPNKSSNKLAWSPGAETKKTRVCFPATVARHFKKRSKHLPDSRLEVESGESDVQPITSSSDQDQKPCSVKMSVIADIDVSDSVDSPWECATDVQQLSSEGDLSDTQSVSSVKETEIDDSMLRISGDGAAWDWSTGDACIHVRCDKWLDYSIQKQTDIQASRNYGGSLCEDLWGPSEITKGAGKVLSRGTLTCDDFEVEQQKSKKRHNGTDAIRVNYIGDREVKKVIDECIERCSTNQQAKKLVLHRISERSFSTWKLHMLAGMSIILCGFGSKREVLRRFRVECLSECLVVEVDGSHYKAHQLANVLQATIHELHLIQHERTGKKDSETEAKPNNRNLGELMETLSRVLCSVASINPFRIVWMVHSLDAPNLRNKQSLIAQLFSLPHSYLIASVDHVAAPLLWDSHTYHTLNPMCFLANSFQNYHREIINASGYMLPAWTGLGGGGSTMIQTDGLEHILKTVTINHKMVLLVLAELTLEQNMQPVSENVLKQKCQESLVAGSANKLRGLLELLIDHQIVIQKGSFLTMPYSTQRLSQIVNDLGKEIKSSSN
eukprot:Filipodium_phascolosomae@DN2002_c0_g1_i3.p1